MLENLGLAVSVLDRIVRPRISRVTLPITYECNQRCKTCDIWQINKKNPRLREKEITLEEFNRFCETSNLLWIAFTGGEPFVRHDIHLVLLKALEKVRLVSLTTNGFSGEKIWDDVYWNCLRLLRGNSVLAINVSFEGPEDIHDEIAGVRGSFQRALDTYRKLYWISTNRDSRLRVGISYTSSSYNQGRFGDFVKELKGEFPGPEGITYGIGQDSPSYYQDSERSEKVALSDFQLNLFIHDILAGFKIGRNPFNYVNKKYLEGLVNGKQPKCVAGQYSLMLDPYWNVYPCMFFCPDNPIGNLREVGFDLKRLDYSKCSELVGNCKGCWTPCEAYSTIVFRPWRAL